MIESKYRIFLESFMIAVIIFVAGFSLGFFVETFRTQKLINNYTEYEVQALDLKLQNYYYQIMDKSSCDAAIEQNFKFADDLYTNGLALGKAEETNQITNRLLSEKKRYVLLKTELWLNTVLLKNKCEAKFDTIVYIYSGDPANSAKVAEQKVISNILKDIKEEKGNKVVLLPIAGDLKLQAVELQKRVYNITSLPSLIINEQIVLEGYRSAREIKSYLKN
jgi:phosphomevalonate kinase